MKKIHFIGILGVALLTCVGAFSATPLLPSVLLPVLPSAISALPPLPTSLAELIRVPSGKIIPANSEQRQPLYFSGEASHASTKITLPAYLKTLAEIQSKHFSKSLLSGDEIEAWPIQNDYGQRSWAFVRKFSRGNSVWLSREIVYWTEEKDAALEAELSKHVNEEVSWRYIAPAFPEIKDLSVDANRSELFDDFLISKDLYFKPRFGDALILNKDSLPLSAWPHPDSVSEFLNSAKWKIQTGAFAVIIAQPPVWITKNPSGTLTRKAFTVRLRWNGKRMEWPTTIEWENPVRASDLQIKIESNPLNLELVIKEFPKDFQDQFMDDVRVLSGEKNPKPSVASFKRKNSADAHNEIPRIVEWLEARYLAMGIETERHAFMWRGIPQLNLIAKIRGTLPEGENHPIWLADHIDTAFSEDTFEKTGKRVSAPGADDNATATAALLQAGRALKTKLGSPLLHDIWLVHLTGEEFPADDLGARALISEMLGKQKSSLRELARARQMQGLLLMDMIGFHKPHDGIFQINAGEGFASERLARIAWLVMHAQSDAGLISVKKNAAQIRLRFDQESYLYNTDGLIFSDQGFPVVLFNEHLNRWDGLMRKHYHDTTDVSTFVDDQYASAIAKIVIETAAQMSVTR